MATVEGGKPIGRQRHCAAGRSVQRGFHGKASVDKEVRTKGEKATIASELG